jgi:hypothetical protein
MMTLNETSTALTVSLLKIKSARFTKQSSVLPAERLFFAAHKLSASLTTPMHSRKDATLPGLRNEIAFG